jgi:hypothetical protein
VSQPPVKLTATAFPATSVKPRRMSQLEASAKATPLLMT